MLTFLAHMNVFLHWIAVILLTAGGIAIMIRFPSRFGQGVGAGLLMMATAVVVYDQGYRDRGEEDQSAALRIELAHEKELSAEKDRRADAFEAAHRAAAQRADQLAEANLKLSAKVKEQDDVSHARDGAPCLDDGGLQRLDSIRRHPDTGVQTGR